MPENITPAQPAAPVIKSTAPSISNSVSDQDYVDHMQLSLNQLETVTLMLQVLDQADGGLDPTE
jgi:hypothetical protein